MLIYAITLPNYSKIASRLRSCCLLMVIGSPSRDIIEPYTACPTTVKTAGAPDINILHPPHRLLASFEPISVALPHSIVTYHACQGEVCQHIGCCLYHFWRVFLSPTASHQSLTCITAMASKKKVLLKVSRWEHELATFSASDHR